MSKEQGTIAKYFENKGFGFIKSKDSEEDVFFHINDCQNINEKHLRQGTTVTFEIVEHRGKTKAANVALCDAEAVSESD